MIHISSAQINVNDPLKPSEFLPHSAFGDEPLLFIVIGSLFGPA